MRDREARTQILSRHTSLRLKDVQDFIVEKAVLLSFRVCSFYFWSKADEHSCYCGAFLKS